MAFYQKFVGSVSRIIDASQRVKLLFLTLDRRKEFSFVPGQNVALMIPGVLNEKGVPVKRLYSIVSTPDSEELEFCFTVYPEPSFSNKLARLKPGDQLQVEGPFGIFKLQPPKPDVTFIAAGTGIAPILCMIRTLVKQKFPHPMQLFFGFRTLADFLYQQELEKYARQANIKLITSISSPDVPLAQWQGYRGRITDVFPKLLQNTGQEVYICGPPAMVKDTTALLIKMGFKSNQIRKEQW